MGIDERRTVGFSVRVDVDLTPELARLWADRLRDELIHGPGDVSDDEGWDAHTADLAALVARSLDRQMAPFAVLHAVIDEHDDMFEDYVWFGHAIKQGA